MIIEPRTYINTLGNCRIKRRALYPRNFSLGIRIICSNLFKSRCPCIDIARRTCTYGYNRLLYVRTDRSSTRVYACKTCSLTVCGYTCTVTSAAFVSSRGYPRTVYARTHARTYFESCACAVNESACSNARGDLPRRRPFYASDLSLKDQMQRRACKKEKDGSILSARILFIMSAKEGSRKEGSTSIFRSLARSHIIPLPSTCPSLIIIEEIVISSRSVTRSIRNRIRKKYYDHLVGTDHTGARECRA